MGKEHIEKHRWGANAFARSAAPITSYVANVIINDYLLELIRKPESAKRSITFNDFCSLTRYHVTYI